MKIHQVKCDLCGRREDLEYNGEHWLHPQGWRQLYDDRAARTVDQHICWACIPNPKKEKERCNSNKTR